jgi:hypothetical protein
MSFMFGCAMESYNLGYAPRGPTHLTEFVRS